MPQSTADRPDSEAPDCRWDGPRLDAGFGRVTLSQRSTVTLGLLLAVLSIVLGLTVATMASVMRDRVAVAEAVAVVQTQVSSLGGRVADNTASIRQIEAGLSRIQASLGRIEGYMAAAPSSGRGQGRAERGEQ